MKDPPTPLPPAAPGTGRERGEAKKNARLEAAAPQLAEMLARWVREWGEFDQFGVPKDDLTQDSVHALQAAYGAWAVDPEDAEEE